MQKMITIRTATAWGDSGAGPGAGRRELGPLLRLGMRDGSLPADIRHPSGSCGVSEDFRLEHRSGLPPALPSPLASDAQHLACAKKYQVSMPKSYGFSITEGRRDLGCRAIPHLRFKNCQDDGQFRDSRRSRDCSASVRDRTAGAE